MIASASGALERPGGGSGLDREQMAERVGFEPTVPLPARRISSAVLSTTQPPLREMLRSAWKRRPVEEAEPLAERETGHKRLLGGWARRP
jgi:hypothetical protein